MLLAEVGKGKRVDDFIAGLAGGTGHFEGLRRGHGVPGIHDYGSKKVGGSKAPSPTVTLSRRFRLTYSNI
jgi:hypothetical protein